MPKREFPKTGLVRLNEVLEFLQICRTAWYDGMKAGIFPQPIRGLGKRSPRWLAEDIWALLPGDKRGAAA